MFKKAIFLMFLIPLFAHSADHYVSGKVTSLLGSGNNPAIRIGANLVPDKCNGGTYGWLYFKGTAQEKQWTYSTALTMAISGKRVTVYTNSDGNRCEITNIQITSGLN